MPYMQPRPASAKLDGTGAATLTFAIDNTNQRWVIDAVTVQTDQALTATPVPVVKFYKNNPGQPQAYVGGSLTGNMDTATGRVVLFPDDTLYAVYSGGIPGSTATVVIDGTFDPAGVPLQD